jgi:predicted SnoaL-like aldol condensation-catalyzing enzyme
MSIRMEEMMRAVMVVLVAVTLAACEGLGGSPGAPGQNGAEGLNGTNGAAGLATAESADVQTATPLEVIPSAQRCSHADEAAKVEANKQVVLKFMHDVLDGHHGDHAGLYLTDDMQWHGGTVGTVAGGKNVGCLMTQVVTSIPDLHADVKDIFGQGNKVVVSLVVSGTLQGSLLGIAGTGQHLQWDAIDLYHLRDCKIVEEWAGEDFTAFLHDTGTYKAPWIP